MKARDKLKQEHPRYVHPAYTGGCLSCPDVYGYLPRPEGCDGSAPYYEEQCAECWDREIPEKNEEEV